MPIVDTSVVLTVLLDEPAAEKAGRVMAAHDGDLAAPDILSLEVANALVNAVRAKRIGSGDVPHLFDQVESIPITLHPTPPLVSRALDLALAYQRRPFDGIFLALSERLNDVLLTTDRRLVNGLAGTPLQKRVELIES